MEVTKVEKKETAIDKVLYILLLFQPDNIAMGNAEISRLTGYHQATTSRMLQSLTKYGFLRQDPETKKYSLGKSAAFLGLAAQNWVRNNILAIAIPYVKELCEVVKYTVTLEILASDNQIVLGYVEPGKKRYQLGNKTGDAISWNTSVGLKAILAYSDQKLISEVTKQEMVRYTKYTITDREKYRELLSEIRKKGYAWMYEERMEGGAGLSAPIFSYERKPVAAISIVGDADEIRQDEDWIAKQLRKQAERISEELFYQK